MILFFFVYSFYESVYCFTKPASIRILHADAEDELLALSYSTDTIVTTSDLKSKMNKFYMFFSAGEQDKYGLIISPKQNENLSLDFDSSGNIKMVPKNSPNVRKWSVALEGELHKIFSENYCLAVHSGKPHVEGCADNDPDQQFLISKKKKKKKKKETKETKEIPENKSTKNVLNASELFKDSEASEVSEASEAGKGGKSGKAGKTETSDTTRTARRMGDLGDISEKSSMKGAEEQKRNRQRNLEDEKLLGDKIISQTILSQQLDLLNREKSLKDDVHYTVTSTEIKTLTMTIFETQIKTLLQTQVVFSTSVFTSTAIEKQIETVTSTTTISVLEPKKTDDSQKPKVLAQISEFVQVPCPPNISPHIIALSPDSCQREGRKMYNMFNDVVDSALKKKMHAYKASKTQSKKEKPKKSKPNKYEYNIPIDDEQSENEKDLKNIIKKLEDLGDIKPDSIITEPPLPELCDEKLVKKEDLPRIHVIQDQNPQSSIKNEQTPPGEPSKNNDGCNQQEQRQHNPDIGQQPNFYPTNVNGTQILYDYNRPSFPYQQLTPSNQPMLICDPSSIVCN